MRLGFFSLFASVLLSACNAWADQVTLNNGDRITGKVVKKDQGSVTFKSDVFGSVTIPWSSVAQLASDAPVTVVLSDGKAVVGKLATADGVLQVTTATATESAVLSEITAIRDASEQRSFERLQNPSVLNLWAGRADVGLSIASGNSQTTTSTVSLVATRQTRSDKAGIHFTQIYAHGKNAQGVKVTSANAARGGWAYDRKVNSRMFLNLLNDYEYDAFQDLDLRFVAGGGAGYSALRRERMQLDLVAGADYNREKYGAPLIRHSGEAYWGDSLSAKVSRTTSLTQSFRMFNNLTQGGHYRMNFDAGTATQLLRWLGWHVTVSDRYSSGPLAGRKRNDVLLTTGLRINFAR